ncbi:class I SAM-dependent methyltransferase [Jiangella rhizosphaerae]|uniref:Class I SAM-dependent methyltransferase n=1 Tax=Jiangella rhizosphaerae TaxID=2293569 RepID=A0A418KI99_9ACTN|nr:class I SAM-dependent methyltransferase [Jiangella rhizosphaerae]RIQ12889.1 class I SAM-dependent methyltransferase [Jiangella rhizosphaerae]
MSTAATGYEQLAEFHDLFMTEPWERLRPHVRAAFAGLDEDAVVVEIGAGTGMGTRVIAGETPARIVALEPALVMRSILTARVADDLGLAERVTVVAGAAPAGLGLLPDRVDGFVCAHMLGHLSRDDRRDLFGWLGAHLSRDGAGLVTTQRRPDPDGGPRAEIVESRRLGSYEYRARHLPPGRPGESVSRYEVWQGATLIRALDSTSTWLPLGAEDIAGDLPPTLALEPVGDAVALVRRSRA